MSTPPSAPAGWQCSLSDANAATRRLTSRRLPPTVEVRARRGKWSRRDSNPWPFDCQSNALPAELRPQQRPQCSVEREIVGPVDPRTLVVPRRGQTYLDERALAQPVNREVEAAVEVAAVRRDGVDLVAGV